MSLFLNCSLIHVYFHAMLQLLWSIQSHNYEAEYTDYIGNFFVAQSCYFHQDHYSLHVFLSVQWMVINAYSRDILSA